MLWVIGRPMELISPRQKSKGEPMKRIVTDIIFGVLITIGLVFGLITHKITNGEFYIAIILDYVGMRYLLMSSLEVEMTRLRLALLEEEEEEEQ